MYVIVKLIYVYSPFDMCPISKCEKSSLPPSADWRALRFAARSLRADKDLIAMAVGKSKGTSSRNSLWRFCYLLFVFFLPSLSLGLSIFLRMGFGIRS